MLTYRGDKFIKGKKFTINESVYRFQKRDNNDNLIFESDTGDKLKLTEDEFNKNVKLKEEANGYSEQYMIDTIKAYYEDNKKEARDMANLFISIYANSDDFPKLQAYVKKLLNRNHGKEEYHSIGSPEEHISSVAREYGVDFNNKTPFEYFYAPDDEEFYSDSYDWASFYDKILHDMGYGENPVLNDLKAEVHEVSDGKYSLSLFINGKEEVIDLRAWDKLEDVKNNVYEIISLLKDNK